MKDPHKKTNVKNTFAGSVATIITQTMLCYVNVCYNYRLSQPYSVLSQTYVTVL